MFSFLKYSIINEAVSVKKQNYSWGKMITVHHGSDTSYPLHPEHQAKIKALGDGEKTSFKDETKRTVSAQRVGDQIHLSSLGSLKKASVARSHFTEEVEIEEAQDINYHRAELKKTSDKIDSIVKGGGKVGLNDPLSKKLKLHSAQIKKLKEEINQIDEESLTAGKRLISKHGEGSHTVRVYKDTEYNEYQVHHYKDGKHMGEGPISYHDDKEDAEDTAKMSLRKRMKEEVEITEISKELLSRYKEKAGAQASNLNRAVDAVATSSAAPEHKKAAIDALVKKGNKRFSGIIKATNKQFAKEEKDKDDIPFTPDKPKTPSAKAGKYGLGYSTAKHLARMALSQQVKKKQDKTS